MTDTGERILTSALRLFARDGYEAVSVSAIAGDVGITKGALYRHYKNKRDIFDSIVGRMVRTDAERAGRFELPQERREDAPQSYERLSVRSRTVPRSTIFVSTAAEDALSPLISANRVEKIFFPRNL